MCLATNWVFIQLFSNYASQTLCGGCTVKVNSPFRELDGMDCSWKTDKYFYKTLVYTCTRNTLAPGPDKFNLLSIGIFKITITNRESFNFRQESTCSQYCVGSFSTWKAVSCQDWELLTCMSFSILVTTCVEVFQTSGSYYYVLIRTIGRRLLVLNLGAKELGLLPHLPCRFE